MSYKDKAKELYNMIAQGQLLEAFEKFYAENIVMEEVGDEPRVGKSVNREYEQKFISSVEAVHGMGVDAITSDEEAGITMVESWMEATLTGMGRIMMKQVAVQKWQGDQIVQEKFYHK